MRRVGVLGAGGRMGREVCRAVSGAADLELVAAVDPGAAGQRVAQLLGGEGPPLQVAADVAALGEAGAEVAVDFTEAAAARRHLAWCAAHGIHAVVGTTGLGEDDLAAAAAAFGAPGGPNAVVAANFAIGAVLLLRFCELAAPFMSGVEIIELHHDAKRDSPSGTAVETARRITEARRRAGSGPWGEDPTTSETLPGARGATAPGGVRIHAVRLPGLVAHEEVVFGAEGQTLSLRHDSIDRASFMPGVLLAVREVAGRPGLTVGLDALLGF